MFKNAISFAKFPRFNYLFLAIILVGANLRAPLTSVGPVLADIQNALGLDGTGAGLLNALPLLIFGLLSLFAPRLGRNYGLEPVIGFALFIITAGTILRSCDFTGAIWLGTLLLSAGIALGNVLLPGLIKRDFKHNTATVISIYAAAMAGFASLAAGLAVPISQMADLDWRWSIGCWALLSAIALIVWLPLLKGFTTNLNIQKANPFTSPWRDATGWHVALFFVFHSLIFYSIVGWFASYALTIGLTALDAGFYLLIYQLVAIVTNLACAPIIAKMKDQTLLGLTCGLLLLIGTLGLYFAPSLSLIWIISLGLGGGASLTTSLAFFGLRTRDHHQAAALSGMAQFIGYMGAALGPFLIGVLNDVSRSWTAPFLVLIGASIMVMIFATLAGRSGVIGN
ncbi:CynX/NimT family MFS transporter [Paraglaciecola hydrolytica]|uniref:MFS transporter n=1 Tax=Paraglaciecola hydrolytica TaxID=1799789 RepID=A0A136A6W9_9ALTE|nr:MFS transporter [Paraglaciecola hydrolytica]KXI30979.1 MFS transporter [Paraglaciecola hydrolytica]